MPTQILTIIDHDTEDEKAITYGPPQQEYHYIDLPHHEEIDFFSANQYQDDIDTLKCCQHLMPPDEFKAMLKLLEGYRDSVTEQDQPPFTKESDHHDEETDQETTAD